MTLDIANYTGREHSYIKHLLLETYLRDAFHKVASRFDEIIYIDGFSGPWNNQSDKFDDTSFGIALKNLRSAKATWLKMPGRNIRVTALLVERDRRAYDKLTGIVDRYPDILVRTFNGDFVSLAKELSELTPKNAFKFIFIDPKGYSIKTSAITPLLELDHTEIIFNFMFDFINRAAFMEDRRIVAILNQLFDEENWRKELENSASAPVSRRDFLVERFSSTLRRLGNFTITADTPILRSTMDRELYALIFATRSKSGLEVFRSSQVKALREQYKNRSSLKMQIKEKRTGQGELFGTYDDLSPNIFSEELDREIGKAKEYILTLVPNAPDFMYFEDLALRTMQKFVCKKSEVNKIIFDMKKSGILSCDDWAPRRRAPEDNYRLSKP